MISERDTSTIAEIATRYGVKRVLVFGSNTEANREPRDIDLAVEGVQPHDFFRFYAELIFGLSKPVDLVDLSQDSRFHRIIRREGVPVYVRPE